MRRVGTKQSTISPTKTNGGIFKAHCVDCSLQNTPRVDFGTSTLRNVTAPTPAVHVPRWGRIPGVNVIKFIPGKAFKSIAAGQVEFKTSVVHRVESSMATGAKVDATVKLTRQSQHVGRNL